MQVIGSQIALKYRPIVHRRFDQYEAGMGKKVLGQIKTCQPDMRPGIHHYGYTRQWFRQAIDLVQELFQKHRPILPTQPNLPGQCLPP
jgi:hypothetical protein